MASSQAGTGAPSAFRYGPKKVIGQPITILIPADRQGEKT